MRISDWSSDVCSSDLRIAHSADKLISFQRLGHQKSEVAFHSLERGRRIRRTHKAGLALDWNGIEENLGGYDAAGQIELFYHFWVEHAIFRKDLLGPKAQGAGLDGVIGSAGFAHHLHIFHRRASRGEIGRAHV